MAREKDQKDLPSMTQTLQKKAEKRAKKLAEIDAKASVSAQKLLTEFAMSLPANALFAPDLKAGKVTVRVPLTHQFASAMWIREIKRTVEGVTFELPLPLSSEDIARLTEHLRGPVVAPEPVVEPVVEKAPEAPTKRRTRKAKAVAQ